MYRSSRQHAKGADSWRDLLPALGLIVASVALSLYIATVSGDAELMGLAVAIGAGIGLVLGSIVWLWQRR